MKLLHKLHTAVEAPWPRWVWSQTTGLRLDTAGQHVASLAKMIPAYRAISTCQIGDGARTAFWLDSWVSDVPLSTKFAALFSHALESDALVQRVLTRGISACLVPRLNSAGARQLPMLLQLLHGRSLTQSPDSRLLSKCAKPDGSLDAAAFYRLCSWGGVEAPYAVFVWKNYAPSKVKFFAWLLSKARIQSRSELEKKHIISSEENICPICSAPDETANHIMFHCSFARAFWTAAHCLIPEDADVRNLHSYSSISPVPAKTASTFILLGCWNLWKHRNGVIFRDQQTSLQGLLQACRSDAALWRFRLPREHQTDADIWLSSQGFGVG